MFRTKTTLGIYSTLVQLFRGILFQGTLHTLFLGGWGEIFP